MEYYDDEERLISIIGGDSDNPYVCSKCFKNFSSLNASQKHWSRCKFFEKKNGILKITVSSKTSEKLMKLCERMTWFSKAEQSTDFRLIGNGTKVFVWFDYFRPYAYLAVKERVARVNGPREMRYCVEDFWVVKHERGSGISHDLFDSMLNHIHMRERDLFYNGPPSEAFQKFMKKRKIDINELEILSPGSSSHEGD